MYLFLDPQKTVNKQKSLMVGGGKGDHFSEDIVT